MNDGSQVGKKNTKMSMKRECVPVCDGYNYTLLPSQKQLFGILWVIHEIWQADVTL
jgi:hypothetical protein